MASLTQLPGSSLAGYLISAPVSMFASGDSLLFEAKLAISTRARQSYNVATISGGQQNIVATGAFVLRWH